MGNNQAPIVDNCDISGYLALGLALLKETAQQLNGSFAISIVSILSAAVSYHQDNDGLSPDVIFEDALSNMRILFCAGNVTPRTSPHISFKSFSKIQGYFQAKTNSTVIIIPYLYNKYIIKVDFAEDDVFKVLAIPYSNRRFLIFLPVGERVLTDALEQLDSERYLQLMGEMYKTDAYVTVPKISTKKMRLKFGELENVASLIVSTVSEPQALADIVQGPSSPINLFADKPFMFALDDGKTPTVFGIFNEK